MSQLAKQGQDIGARILRLESLKKSKRFPLSAWKLICPPNGTATIVLYFPNLIHVVGSSSIETALEAAHLELAKHDPFTQAPSVLAQGAQRGSGEGSTL